MTLYRLFVADIKESEIVDIVGDKPFNGFTMYRAAGYWQGQVESVIVIEILTDSVNETLIKETAKRLRDYAYQDCVLLQKIECKGELI